MKRLIQELCNLYGPSGQEEAVRDYIAEQIRPHVDEMRVDPLGNLVARRAPTRPQGQGRRLLLAAHMDEIGVMVTHVDEKGFLRFTGVGFPLRTTLLGSRVVFSNGVHGTFGLEGKPLPTESPVPLEKLFLDVGATSREDVPVEVGDVAVFRSPVVEQGRRILGPSFDDRLGCAVLIQVLQRLQETPHELYVAFTVQEELGLRGATTAAYSVAPEVALAVDITLTGDYPEAEPMAVGLGKGPAIKVKDRRMVAHPQVRRWLVRSAEAASIPYQMEVLDYGSTDAAAMQIGREGALAGALSIPCRYAHAPTQMADLEDLEHGVALLLAGLQAEIA